MNVKCSIFFFFSWKYDTDLQLSLFFLKVVVLRRSVARLSHLPPNAREAVYQPSQSAILRVSKLSKGGIWGPFKIGAWRRVVTLFDIHSLRTFRPLKMGPPRCSETSATRHPVTQRHIPGERGRDTPLSWRPTNRKFLELLWCEI